MSKSAIKQRQSVAKPLLSSLQVYRGIAALLVVFYHITHQIRQRYGVDYLGGIFQFGYTGVDFFFVLSGFVISYVHHNDIGVARRAGEYLAKRAVRIYPIYWLVASFKIAILPLVPSLSASEGSGPVYFIKSLLLLPQAILPVIGVAWTLSYELLFYLFFMTFILFGRRWALASMTVWVTAILAHAIFDLPAGSNSYLLGSFLLNERNLEFLLGYAVAGLVLGGQVKGGWLWALAGLVGFSLSALYVNLRSGQEPASFTLTFGLSSALLLIGSVALELRRGRSWPWWLGHLGDASYSIYLTHAMFFNIGFVFLDKTGVAGYLSASGEASLLVPMAVGGGIVVYHVAERPLIAWFRRRLIHRRPVYATSQTAVLVQPSAES